MKPHLETGSHTPGPWEVGPMNGKPSVIYADDYDAPVIAQMAEWIPDAAKQQEANARLIAAAPELLEALQMAVECNVFDYHGGDAAQGRICDKCKAADAASAAIAKATGAA